MTEGLAILGAALGVLNSFIVVWQWQRSGPNVKVELRAGWQVAGGGIASFSAEDFDVSLRPTDGVRAVVVVAVTNAGRSAVDVTQWWVTIGPTQLGMVARVDEETVAALGSIGMGEVLPHLDDLILYQHNEPCPCRLNDHASRNWVLKMDNVAEVVRALRERQSSLISATVALGNGKSVKAKQQVSPASLGIDA